MKANPVQLLAQQMHALLRHESPLHIEVLAAVAQNDGVDVRTLLDEMDAIQPLYIYGPMVGLA